MSTPLPAWSSNRLSRLTGAPRRYLVDPRWSARWSVWTQPESSEIPIYGVVMESFVVSQLRPELAVAETAPRLYHLRQQEGRHEVDIIVEFADGRVVGIEVTAVATAHRSDVRYLIWLRDHLGDQLICGLVLRVGRHGFVLGGRIHARAGRRAVVVSRAIRWR